MACRLFCSNAGSRKITTSSWSSNVNERCIICSAPIGLERRAVDCIWESYVESPGGANPYSSHNDTPLQMMMPANASPALCPFPVRGQNRATQLSFTAFFNVLLALKPGVLVAGIWIFERVCGFTPSRA